MRSKKTDLAIVNRSFWPQSQVIGEGLLQFAEHATKNYSVCVITQAETDLQELLKENGRGQGLVIRACKSYTTSASGVLKRIAEAVFFMLWTFFSLVRARPANVYVSTNPPVVVPFVVALYCRLFKARYVYHLQDIHPEATNIVVPLNKLVFHLLKTIDNYTLRHAGAIITLSEDMKQYIQQRSGTTCSIHLLDNPSFEIDPLAIEQRTKDIVFCGNAGRLQRIPLLITAIKEYLRNGGKLHFTFAGGGVYASDILELSKSSEQVDYLGVIPATQAAAVVNNHNWALMPIVDEVTRFAFPSKSSGYVLSGAGILAICGTDTSVARWIVENEVGLICAPEHKDLVSCFFELENKKHEYFKASDSLREKLQIPYFAEQLLNIVVDSPPQTDESSKSNKGMEL